MSTRKRKLAASTANGVEPLTKKRKLDTCEKKENVSKNRKDSHLFTDDNPHSTVHGTGFNSKEKADGTIKMMEGRDITYQFQVINTMYYRAKSVLKRTKNATKVKCIQEAIDVFEPWLNDYKANNRKMEMLHHLPLDVMEQCEPLADYYQIDKAYLNLYRQVNGDPKMLRITKVPRDILSDDEHHIKNSRQITWDIYRNQMLRKLKQEMNATTTGSQGHNSKNEAQKQHQFRLYCAEHSLVDGLPTSLHTRMIMYGYTPDSKRKLIKTVTNNNNLRQISQRS